MSLEKQQKPSADGDAPVHAKQDTSDQQANFLAQSLNEVGAKPIQRKASGNVRQQSLGEIGSAIQRSSKEEGAPELGDGEAQDVATEGVADANSPLPHGDEIQRSFGEHDVSNVKAQVGGPATTAGDSLGANAYATGDRVGFTSAPDLHTAAHEAAHVVQQRAGKVDQGLGLADDGHERQADAVADKVVAGQKAEPLLNEIAGTGSSKKAGAGDAVQLDRNKKKDPAPKTLARSRADLVLLALRNAEGEARQWATAKDTDRVRIITDTRIHLHEASTTYAAGIDGSQLLVVQGQMEATSLALKPLLGAASSMPEHGDRLKALGDQEQKLRGLLLMPAVSATGVKSTKAKELNEREALGPAIDVARFEAEAAYDQLVAIDMKTAKWRKDQGDARDDKLKLPPADGRDSVINKLSASLQQQLGYAVMLNGDSKASESTALKPQLEAASRPMQKIRSWIFGKQANVAMLGTFDLALNDLDDLRMTMGMGPLAREDIVNLARVSDEEKTEEQLDIDKAEKDYGTALGVMLKGFEVGADRFEKFSQLEKPPTPPSFWEELAKGILVSVAGNLAGPIAGTIFKKAFKQITDTTLDTLKGITIDSIEAIGGKMADGAFSKVKNENEKIRGARLFNEYMQIMQINMHTQAMKSLSTRIRSKKLSAQDLVDMSTDLDQRGGGDSQTIADAAYRECAHGYALFNAQQGLKEKKDDKVSNMTDYFGKKEPLLTDADRIVGNKEGATGVAKITVDIEDPAEYRDSRFKTGDFASSQITNFEIHGMNDDMAKATLEHAKFKILDLNMPLEIHFNPPWWGKRSAKAALAIDEAGNLRSARGWEAFDPTYFSATAGGGEGRRKQAKNADFYSTPEKMWQALQNDSIPPGSVK